MTMIPSSNPFGGSALADKRFGNVYPIIKAVYEKLGDISYLAEHLTELRPENVELRVDEATGYLQWRYVPPAGTTPMAWVNLWAADDSVFAVQQPFAGAAVKTQHTKNQNILWIKDTAAVCDGVADDTLHVLAVHTFANLIGYTVSYEGLKKIAIQADAQIPVKTSVDFANAEIVVLGGVVADPSFSDFNEMFLVSDDDCPLVTVTGAVTSTNLTKGAMFPTLGLFNGHGYALLECALQVPNRDKTGTQNYTQSFKVNRNGRVSLPLSTDASAHAAAITVKYRKTSKKRLKIENVHVREGTWNNQRIFKIERCNVEVNGFTLLQEADGTFDNVCELVCILDASDIDINRYVTTGRPTTGSEGSYSLAIYGGADIYVDRMNALTGWGATGTNNINGLHFTRSILNRVDVHSSGHNVTADDCDLHEAGMVYGWGGGVWSLKNSRLHRCSGISTRQDYGGTFFGDIVVADVETENNFTSTYRLVDLETNPLGASTPVSAPQTISIHNVKRTGKASANNAEFIPVALKIRGATDVVYAPSSVTVRNVTCFPLWRFGLRLDTRNMEGNLLTSTMMLEVSGVYPDTSATSTTGILDFASIRTPTTAVRCTVRAADADNIHIQNTSQANLDIKLTNVGVNGVATDLAAPTQPVVLLNGCTLRTAASGYTNAPIGGNSVSPSAHTVLKDCDIHAVAFDLSRIGAAIGNTVRNGANQPLLPSGVTNTLLFTGWRATGMFSS